MTWRFTGSAPVYQQIMEQIRSAILSGTFQPGGRIPPVREFAAQAQVNPNTMQRALLELEREGLLIAQGSNGRFVTTDVQILQTLRTQTVDDAVRAAAAQFRAMGIDLKEAAALLIKLEQEESHG